MSQTRYELKKNISHRSVFFISGFDPRGIKHYYNLYKHQSALQAKITKLQVEISSCKAHAKHIHEADLLSTHEFGSTKTKLYFLEWNDIVRRFWPKTLKEKFLALINYFCFMANHPLFKISPMQYASLGVPFLFVLGTISSFMVVEWLVKLITDFIPSEHLRLALMIFGFALGLLIFPLILSLTKKLGIAWLTNSYAFTHQWAKSPDANLQERIQYFAANIVKAIHNKQMDEIQVVAHSSGSLVAIAVMAEVLIKLQELDLIKDKRLVLITLGACIPILYSHEQAGHYRRALKTVRDHKALYWLDYGDTTDFISYPLWGLDKNIKNKKMGACIQVISINFRALYSKLSFKKIQFNLFTQHFLYLMANEVPNHYDYFCMTAGPLSARNFLESRHFDIFYAYGE